MARTLHYGPARVPSRESPDAAIAALLSRGFSACEIDFEGGFWMDYDFAERFGELAREHDVALSVHALSSRLDWVRPVVDFAHMHATTDGALTSVEPFVEALAKADAVIEPGAPFHIHFSDIQFANRNETKHLPYGEGTLRAEPLRDALTQFERPATVISESPTSESTDEIKAILGA